MRFSYVPQFYHHSNKNNVNVSVGRCEDSSIEIVRCPFFCLCLQDFILCHDSANGGYCLMLRVDMDARIFIEHENGKNGNGMTEPIPWTAWRR